MEKIKLRRILEGSGFIPISVDTFAILIPTKQFVIGESDNPGFPTPPDKNSILIKANLNKKSHSLLCDISSIFSGLDDTHSAYSMLAINADLMGAKIAKHGDVYYLVSSLNFDLYEDLTEEMLKEAVFDIRVCADTAYSVLKD